MLLYSGESSRQYGSTHLGIQPLTIEMGILGHSADYANGSAIDPFALGNVSAMFDRGLLDMAAADPQKGVWQPGAYISEVQATLEIGTVATGAGAGGSVEAVVPSPGDNLAMTTPPDATGNYLWTPLNSWKYWPQSVSLKFMAKLRRTFYNPTNRVMTVYVTELRRKRKQLTTAQSSTGLPSNTRQDFEVLDLQPWSELQRSWYVNTSGACGAVYCPVDSLDGASILLAIRQGEYYRRFLYVRFGQYESIQYQNKALTLVVNRTTGETTPYYAELGRWDPRMSYNPTAAEPTDPLDPETHGYSQAQFVRDPTTATIGGFDVSGGQDPWNSVSGNPTEYEIDVTFNPLKNPFLRKLFYMRRTRYVIPPGGSATHTYRCGGRANPFRSNLLQSMHFYSERGALTYGTEAKREGPYGLPFADALKPPPLAHASKRDSGWSDVSSLVQVKGQMVFEKDETISTSEVMQYSQTRVISHDHYSTRFKVCSYGRPTVGGARAHSTFLSSSDTASDFYTVNPTAAPTAVAPTNNGT